MVVWLVSLWGVRIPFISQFASVLLDSLIILTLAIVFWQFISSWIERQIEESIPEEEEDEDIDDEWGASLSRPSLYAPVHGPKIHRFGSGGTCHTMMILSSMEVDSVR